MLPSLGRGLRGPKILKQRLDFVVNLRGHDFAANPLTQLDAEGTAEHFADKFDKESFSNLWFSIGLVAAF